MRPSSLAKRKRYLDAATTLFLEQGYDATGLDQLIKHCGGSKLTLYSYFGDKKGLLKAVVVEMTEQLENLLTLDQSDDNSPRDALIRFSLSYLRFVYHPDMLRLFRLVLSKSLEEPELTEVLLDRGPRKSQQILKDYLAEQAALGQLNIEDPLVACEQLLGALKGNYYFEALLGGKTPAVEQLGDYAALTVDAFLACYG